MTKDEIIQKLKGRFTTEMLRIVLDDPKVQRIIAAWSAVADSSWVPPEGEPEPDGYSFVSWAWNAYQVDSRRLADTARVNQTEVLERLPGLKACGIILPDGTVHETAAQVVRARVAADLRTIRGKTDAN